MTTANTAAASATGADPGERGPATRVAPTVHAVPVDHASRTVVPVDPSSLPVRPGEDPWTAEELDEVRQTLIEDTARFEAQIATSNAELVNLLRDGTEGAGRDPADVGSANFERDAEMSLANNAREMLDQSPARPAPHRARGVRQLRPLRAADR